MIGQIRDMTADDWPQVCEIYTQGIATGDATFETQTPCWRDWDADHHAVGRLIAADGPRVLGWVALSPVSRRPAYSGVAEVSVYVAEIERGKGIGTALLKEAIRRSERSGIWTLQASIMAENTASIELHCACGFREIGRRERIGRLHGVWRDTVLLERRSDLVA